MKLPISLPFQKKDQTEYYLSLLLSDEKLHAVVFEEVEGKIHIVGEHEEHLLTPFEDLEFEKLLELLDRTISQAEKTLPKDRETEKTIFGVKETWIEETKIKKDYLVKLKKICDALGLSPLGFLVISEAVTHLLEKEEGAPPSAILAEVGDTTVAVSIVKAGRVLETKRHEIEESLAKTIDKLLHHFTAYEILPSRVIVFNSKNHEKVSQELISHQWSKSLPFLHVPQITVLPRHFDARAILAGAATQMGFELADTTPAKPHKDNKELIASDEKNEDLEEKEESAEKTAGEEGKKEDEDEEDINEDKDFGFVQDKDITEVAKEEKTQPQKHTPPPYEDTVQKETDAFFTKEHEMPQIHEADRKEKMRGSLTPLFSKIRSIIPQISLWSPSSLSSRRGLLFIPPVLLILVILFLLFYLFAISATATIVVDPKTVEKDKQVAFSEKDPTDPETGVLHVDPVSSSETGSVSTQPTGTKEIGDKAKGAVTVLSSSTKAQTIPSGTVITSSNGLAFALDNSISLASSSGISDIKSVQASVTAKDIGKEYNIPSGTKFSVGNFDRSSIEAKNDNAFSGGSKKEITVVSTKDQNKLLTDLSKNLEQKAKDSLTKKISGDQILLSLITDQTISKKSFNKDVGEETSSVTLTATITYEELSYKKSDAEKFGQQLISEGNDSFAPTKEGLSYSISDTQKKGTKTTGKFHAKATLMPRVDETKLQEQIAGKSFTDAKQILLQTPQAKDATFILHPSLPFLPPLLPRSAKKIEIRITPNG